MCSARYVRTNATYFTNIINKLVFYYSTLLGKIVVVDDDDDDDDMMKQNKKVHILQFK